MSVLKIKFNKLLKLARNYNMTNLIHVLSYFSLNPFFIAIKSEKFRDIHQNVLKNVPIIKFNVIFINLESSL